MTRKKRKRFAHGEEVPSADAARSANAEAPEKGTQEEREAPLPDLEERLKALEIERDEFRDKFLRAQAECVNITKRLHQQHVEASRLAGMELARSLLPVLDSLERTLASFDESAKEDPVRKGVQLITDEFLKALFDHGIVPIESVGQPFDPTLHEAMMQDQKSECPPGTVSQEFQRGYKLHDRVLRPSKVAVSAEKPADREKEGVNLATGRVEGPDSSDSSAKQRERAET